LFRRSSRTGLGNEKKGTISRLLGKSEGNVAGQKNIKKALENSEECYRDLVEKAGIGILVDDQDGNFKYANKRYAEMFGYSLKEMNNQSIRTLVHPDDLDRVLQYHYCRHEGKKSPSRFSFKGIKKGGSPIFLEMEVVPLKEKGRKTGTRSYIWDVTVHQKAQDQVQETLEKLRRSLNATIHAMALTVEVRDPFTSGHHRRVADLARAIATEMKVSKDQIDGIRAAGAIHDLGKICVPAEILSKPGKLNSSEFDLIKAHPKVAYDILKDIEFPWPVALIVHQHHERLDGSGYPQGLKGDHILLEARIIAVADVVEAMSSHRPYRPSLGLENALEEIATHRGSYYDPKVVDACTRLFNEKRFEFK
jgi:PAS domain S-box-containing protein